MTATASRASAAGQAGRPRSDPAWLTDGQLTARLMSPLARCAAYGLNPEDWFPIATGPTAHEPNPTTLALCAVCPVRAECLEFEMRHWSIGRHGIWGGLVETERGAVRRAWRARTADPMAAGNQRFSGAGA